MQIASITNWSIFINGRNTHNERPNMHNLFNIFILSFFKKKQKFKMQCRTVIKHSFKKISSSSSFRDTVIIAISSVYRSNVDILNYRIRISIRVHANQEHVRQPIPIWPIWICSGNESR